ncbi:hypothetical protein FA10DRAFT_268488 [Acaromyces ingoldii]|uniref:Integral membrane protein, Mpv17/PMP22 family n=1 Tax=Acaromyces ingoldii TaxID=215250 RepID=A0A316YKP3_9BASI|nr:hypothetical protein FA10DRAFT_268488 [Acaromyces ingoldii]PWN88285.1 hypothetical protein FA10DRAFT_268488 [Acaromyces ingoldii]
MAHRRFGAFYARSFERRPWLTLAVANASLGALSDVLAQTFERFSPSRPQSTLDTLKDKVEGREAHTQRASQGWDVARTSRFFAFGAFMAPLLAEWNRFIEYRFPLKPAGAAAAVGKVSLRALGKRVAVDQILFAPFGLAMFVGSMGLMEGRHSYEALSEKFSDVYVAALVANWKLWPLVQTINFRFMPLRYRVPFTGAVGIGWQVFLSVLNSAKGNTAK